LNKGLVLFLVFLGVLALGLSLTAMFLGPNVLAFVFHDERSSASVTMVELVRYRNVDQARRFDREFLAPARSSAEAVGGKTVWRATTELVVNGVAADEWSELSLVAYPSRAAYVDLVTSADFRALAEVRDGIVGGRASLAGTPLSDFLPGDAGGFVVRFLMRQEEEPADWWRETADESKRLLDNHGGSVVWRAALNPLVADDSDAFDQVVIIGFADLTTRDAWLHDPARSTLYSLQRRHLQRDVLLVVNPLG